MRLFVVRWCEDQYDYDLHPHRLVRAFTRKTRAVRHRDDLNRGRLPPPPGANPFMLFRVWRQDTYRIRLKDADEGVMLAKLTSFPDNILCDWVLDCGLVPPERTTYPPVNQFDRRGPMTYRDWFGWWEENAPKMDDYQRQKVWQALDRLEFFEVVGTKLE